VRGQCGTGAGEPLRQRRLVSFSQYFLTDVFSGYDVGTAFTRARTAVRRVSGRLRQEPQLDDNGDGLCNGMDGEIARQRHIGGAFVTGADVPVVGSAMPSGLLAGVNPPLWAADVTAMDGLSNVWCLITPPDYDGTGDLAEVSLTWNPAMLRYESAFTNATQAGAYVCTFQASTRQGSCRARCRVSS